MSSGVERPSPAPAKWASRLTGDREPSRLVSDAIGGARGIIDSGLAALIFVGVNALAGLGAAVVAAVGCGVLLVVVRLLRREPIQQALAGFVGLGIAVFVAARLTHSAEGFFLPGIIYQALLAVVALVSLAVRRPYIGYVMALLDRRYVAWRESTSLRRAMAWATALWAAIFLIRTGVLGTLYAVHRPGWLAVTKIALGWPLFVLALAATYALARRAATDSPPEDVDEGERPQSVR